MAAPSNQPFMYGSMPASSAGPLAPGANPLLPRASFGDTTPSPSSSSSSTRANRPLIPRFNSFPSQGSNMPTAGGINGGAPPMGNYYPSAGQVASGYQQQVDAMGQPFVGPSGHEAGVTHSSSSTAFNNDGKMYQQTPAQIPYPSQQGYPPQQQMMGDQQYLPQHSYPMGPSFPSKPDASSSTTPSPTWKTSGAYGPGIHHPSGTDGLGGPFDYDPAVGMPPQYWHPQQQGMFPPTEVFSRMPHPNPPPPPPPPASTAPSSGAAGPSAQAYSSQPPPRAASPPGSPKAAPKKPPRPPNAWILYRSETLTKMSRGERIPLLEQVLLEQYGPPKFPPQSSWPVPGESTEEEDGAGANQGPKSVRKGKKGGKDINWYMWMLGLIRSPDGGMPQSDVSRIISSIWRREPEPERRRYDNLSQVRKAEHLQKYPGYKFQPQKREDKMREKQVKLKEKEARRQEKEDRVHPLKRRKQRRSPSAELSDYHPYHVPSSIKRNSNGPYGEHERLEVPLDAFRAPVTGFESFAPKMAPEQSQPSSSPSTQASKPAADGARTAADPSPEQISPPPADTKTAFPELPIALGDGPRPVSWLDMQPVAPPAPQVAASLFNPAASNFQPDPSTESQYYFQPLTGTLPLDFMNVPLDNVGDDDELDNLVAGWAANASDVNLEQLTSNWDAHESSNPVQIAYGEGPIMDAIKSEWNNFFVEDGGANTFQPADLSSGNFSLPGFPSNMALPQGPPLSGPLSLSPVDSQREPPIPPTTFPEWTISNRDAGSGDNSNSGNLSASAFTLSVDPAAMGILGDGWANSGELVNYDDGSTVASAGASSQQQQQSQGQGSMMPPQQQQQRQTQQQQQDQGSQYLSRQTSGAY